MKLCFVGLVFAFSAVLLKNLGWRGACVFSALCITVLLADVSSYFSDIIKLFNTSSAVKDSTSAILKIIGIGYLFGISSEICRELGEGGISSALTLVGRLEIIAVVIPFISELIALAMSLVS